MFVQLFSSICISFVAKLWPTYLQYIPVPAPPPRPLLRVFGSVLQLFGLFTSWLVVFFLHLPTVFDWFRVWVCHLQCSDRSLCLTPLFECVFNVSSHTLHQSRTFLQVLLLLSRPVSIRDSRSLFCSAVQNALKANFFFL